MNLPKIVPHDEWLVARKQLLARKRLLAKERTPTPQSGPRRRADRLGNHRPRDPRTHR
jgi:hypothetical protein